MRGVDAVVGARRGGPQAGDGGGRVAGGVGHRPYRSLSGGGGAASHSGVAQRVALAPDGYRRAGAWMGGMPWDDPEQYVKHSPIFFAENFRTPTLVIAGGSNARAGGSDAGAEELYFALRARNVDAALVRIADDGKPGAWVLELGTMLGWLGRF